MISYRIINSNKETFRDYLKRIIQNRVLIYPIILKDTKLKYHQTFLGGLWTILYPFLSVVLYVIFFGYIFKIPLEHGNYLSFVLTGYACWNIFSNVSFQSGNALIQNQELIRKLSIPKIIFPICKSITVWYENIVLLLVAFTVLFFNENKDYSRLIWLPVVLIGLFVFSIALGTFISALTIYKKDLNHGIPIIMQALIWFTPVFYPISILPDFLKKFIFLNPFASFIELFRWTLGVSDKVSPHYFIGLIIAFIFTIFSFIFFKKREDIIIDYL
ncbi:MAG: ABC transporter permease [Chitinophagales bacterium]|nr:ABC transporter permease [Chitinophagales bacterium]